MSTALQNISPAKSLSPADVLQWQDEILRLRQTEFIGRIMKIQFEAAKDAPVPENSVTSKMGVCLDWYGVTGPSLAQSLDHSALILLSPILRSDGTVGVPDMPDPLWIPPIPKREEIENLPAGKYYEPPKPRMIAQKLEDRARGMWKDYYLCGPVSQILVRPEGLAEGWIILAHAEPRNGTQMELLIHRNTGRSYLYGGRFEISRIG